MTGMDINGVLFDFEGTLVDFQWRLEPGETELRNALAALGFDRSQLERESYATMWNRAVKDAEERRRAELAAKLLPIYDRYDRDALSRWALREDAVELLRRLRRAGLALGIVSNVGREALGRAVCRFGLDTLVHVVFSRNDVTLMKPAGEGIRAAAQALGVPVNEVLMVGDSRADILAARAAGARVAIIAGGESDPATIALTPPDFLFGRLLEVEGLVVASRPAGEERSVRPWRAKGPA